MKITINIKKVLFAAVPILLAYFFVLQPVLHDGLFHVYDNVQVTRVIDMASELKSGQFPVRYSSALGNTAGYFLFHFNSPLIYYLGGAINLLGFTPIQSVKLVYLIFTTLGMVGMFMLLKSQFKLFASTVGTILFLLSPYFYHDFFHRGSLAESSSFMLIPFVVWGALQLRKHLSIKYTLLTGFFLGLALLAHALAGGMALILVGFITLFTTNKKFYLYSFLAILLSFALSAFYLIPSFIDTKYITYQENPFVTRGYIDHPVPLVAHFGSFGVAKDPNAYLGLALSLGLIFLALTFIASSKFKKSYFFLSIFSFISSLAGIIIMLPESRFLWENISYLRFVQFPFRFLTMVTVTGNLGITILLDYFHKNKIIISSLLVTMIAAFILDFHYYKPLGYQYGTDYNVEDPCKTTAWASEHLPIAVKNCLKSSPKQIVEVVSGSLAVSDIVETDHGRKISFQTKGKGEVIIGRYYFPMWQATLDGNDLNLSAVEDTGLIKLNLENDGLVQVYLEETLLSKICNYISIVTWLLVIVSATLITIKLCK